VLRISFDPEALEAIKYERLHHPHPRVQQKMWAVWLRADGLPHHQICRLADVTEPRLEQAKAGTRKVYFVDAAHFVQSAFLGFLWCFTRVFVRSSSGGQRFNVLGALCATTHQLTTVCNTGYINSGTVCELLCKLAALTDLSRFASRKRVSTAVRPDHAPAAMAARLQPRRRLWPPLSPHSRPAQSHLSSALDAITSDHACSGHNSCAHPPGQAHRRMYQFV
jgi:hypothetical protein